MGICWNSRRTSIWKSSFVTEISGVDKNLKPESSASSTHRYIILHLLLMVPSTCLWSFGVSPLDFLKLRSVLLFMRPLEAHPLVFMLPIFRDRHFRFSVASRHVGFAIRDLNRIVTEQFDVYFHLWRDGGADWFGNGANGRRRRMLLGSLFNAVVVNQSPISVFHLLATSFRTPIKPNPSLRSFNLASNLGIYLAKSLPRAMWLTSQP
jgi:hypothetical protein